MASCQVITVAMSDGADAEEIGREAAKQLGFRYINDEVVYAAAEKANVGPEEVESVEHTKSLVDRIFAALGSLSLADGSQLPPDWAFDRPAGGRDESILYRNLIREVLWETGIAGKVVIGAHAASIQLAGMAGLLRVFVTGSPEKRAERYGSTKLVLPEDAKKHIEHGDHERQAYLRRFYDMHQELPTHYDLVVNTDVLPAAAAVQAIVGTARAMA